MGTWSGFRAWIWSYMLYCDLSAGHAYKSQSLEQTYLGVSVQGDVGFISKDLPDPFHGRAALKRRSVNLS
jgi:hypothetical protein